MDSLRGVCESLGCRNVQTYLQSGNAIFKVPARDVNKLPARIEDALESEFGFRPLTITRTVPDLRAVVAHNPFAGRADIHPSKFLVTFLSAEPSADARRKLEAMVTDPEELHLRKREFYMYFPDGLARPKTAPAAIEKALQVRGTGRNWSVVTKLLELAEQMESQPRVRQRS